MLSETFLPLGLILAITCVGCTTGHIDAAPPMPRPSGDPSAARAPADKPGRAQGIAPGEPDEATGYITLQDALSFALMRNPSLAAYAWEVRAAEAGKLQAGLRPNPEIAFTIEGFAGTGDAAGTDTAEWTLQFSQLVELGGKRKKRTRMASLVGLLRGWDYEVKRLDVFAETTHAFVDVLSSQHRRAIARDFLKLSEELHRVVVERVQAGKVSPLEESKARVVLETSKIELDKAQRALSTSRKRLAASWASDSPAFQGVRGDLEAIAEAPSLDHLLALTLQNPEIARRQTETALRRAAIDMARASGRPDLTVNAGMQHFQETGDQAFLFGFSIPLPFFDRNQGGVQEARHRYHKALAEQQAVDIKIRTDLSRLHAALTSAYRETLSLKTDVLPAAEQAFHAAREGYQLGKFGYLDVLDAQRTFFGIRAQYIESLSNYHNAVADIERFIGRKLAAKETNAPTRKETPHE